MFVYLKQINNLITLDLL
uniref:Uncharacterized protein n=1 Tax=Anguilla anguilla TaxID=7936 RepID=A0A0E9XW00_ANGAN